ncbi:hypothetical protein C8Q76DRAFT_804787 [Earliella scabrosa]|nr:hypothetical protein C8Q76DRAFT_804787 [Earliella scabrosa]
MDEYSADPSPTELHTGWGALFDDGFDDDVEYAPSAEAEYDSDRLSDDSDWDPVEIQEPPTHPPIQLQQTHALRARLENSQFLSMVERVCAVLKYMEDLEMNLPIFLDALSWGDDDCIVNPKVQYARTALMVSEELPRILDRWYKVPHASTSRTRHVRPQGARKALEKFAMNCVADIIDRELEATAPIFRSRKNALSEDGLKSFQFAEVASQLEGDSGAPNTFALLRGAMHRAVRGKSQPDTRSRKNTIYVRDSCVTGPLTVFLKAKGVSAKALDLLHMLGITMSHSWSVRAYAKISREAMELLQRIIVVLAWWLAYDNVNFAFRVFSQRLDNQSHFDSGTTGSVFVKPNAPQPRPMSSPALQEQRRKGRLEPITVAEIIELESAAAPRVHGHIVYAVLKILLDSPAFDFETYKHRDHPALSPPSPVRRLPSGPEHITKQFVLGTVHIDEASYDGTDDLIKEWLRQLKLDTPEELRRMGDERVLVWIGDQLTVDRLRGLANLHGEDDNGYDRLDWLVTVFGWFHLQMAFANSLHRQYFGSGTSKGLRAAFALLNRKGLQSVQIKGTFHHHLHEGILHVAEAHIRDCWSEVSGVEKLNELRDRSPEELVALAERLVDEYASNEAVEDLEEKPEGQSDDVMRQAVMWNRDVLYYLVLQRAMKTGDVGLMEDLLPHLFFRFCGGGNHKYAVEILELLQGLHKEWTNEVKEFVRENCWLVNLKGGTEDFAAIDLVEEHTVKDVKVTYRPKGPNSSWDLMKARAPAIPTLRSLDEDFNHQFRTIYRGTGHTDPEKEKDVQKLTEHYAHAGLHTFQPGRTVTNSADTVKEFVSDGVQTAASKIVPKWVKKREIFERSSAQTWPASSRSE